MSRMIAYLRFLSKGVQTKMLREIQYPYFRMIRSEKTIVINCRVLARYRMKAMSSPPTVHFCGRIVTAAVLFMKCPEES